MDRGHVQHLQLSDPDTKVRLVAQGRNLWRVRMLFPNKRATEIPEQLRQIKDELAHNFGVANHRLEYVGLISKKRTHAGVLVEMQIRRQDAPSGAVRLRFEPAQAPDGTEFSDMKAIIDLFPLDEFEQTLTFAAVEQKLKAEGLELVLVKWPIIRDLVDSCVDRQAPIFDHVVAEGVLPDIGIPSRISYPWFPQSDEAAVTAWMGLRAVDAGEELVEVSVPVSGMRAGRNVFGRELSPRRGIVTRLQGSHGVVVAAGERRMQARERGLLVFRRIYSDRRTKDSPREMPMLLEAEVMRIRGVDGDAADVQRWEETVWISGDLNAGARLHVNGDCVIDGDVPDGCQVTVAGSLRVYGSIGEAAVTTGGHLCVHGDLQDTLCEVGLVVQIIGVARESEIFAREILADHLEGGTAEAFASPTASNDVVHFNREKFLAEQRAAGEDALATLRRQITQLYEIFGPEILQQVTPDTVQIHLLRWLRQQKNSGAAQFSHPQVQELRTLLELVPSLRSQMTQIAGELRLAARGPS